MIPPYLPLLATDFESIKAELINRAKALFPDWSDVQESNNMIMLIEMFAGTQEQTIVYLNRQARECFLKYAQDPSNVEALAWGLGYTPKYQTPSSVSAMIAASGAPEGSTPIPAGTKFSTTMDNVFYETVNSFTFPAGATSVGPVLLNQQETWDISGTGTGLPNQTVSLIKSPVMPTSIVAIVDGKVWEQVEHFVDSDATSEHYKVTVDLYGYATLHFGDGVNGKMPSGGGGIGGTYKTGGGKNGAIAANQLSTCVSSILDSMSGKPLSLSASNAFAAVPGGDKETVDQIRVRAPSNLKTPRSLLTLEDIEAEVIQLPGIEAVKAVNWLLTPALPHHIVQVYVAPTGAALTGATPTAALIASVETFITVTKPIVMGNVPQVMGPTYRVVDYTIQVGIKPGYEAVDVTGRVTAQLRALFDLETENIWGFKPTFGHQIYESHLIMILQQVPGVRNVNIVSPGNVLLAANEYPRLGTVTVLTA